MSALSGSTLAGMGSVQTAAEGTSGGNGTANVTGTAPIVVTGTTTKNVAISPATDIAAGSLSAADKTKIDGYASPGWYDANVNFMGATVPALTAFKPWFPVNPQNATLGASISDANIEGGGWQTDGNWAVMSPTIAQLPKTGQYAGTFQGKLAALTNTLFGFIGFTSAGHDRFIGFCTDKLGTATGHASNNFGLVVIGAGSPTWVDTGIAADTALHTFGVFKKNNALLASLDGVVVATTADFTQMDDTKPLACGYYASSTLKTAMAQAAWGYVG